MGNDKNPDGKKDESNKGDQPDFDDDDIKIIDAIWDKIGKNIGNPDKSKPDKSKSKPEPK